MSDINPMPQLDPETQEMIRSFVSESIDSLDTNEPLVDNLRLEDNSEYVNAIFRVFHTLKGLSGFFEMYVINKVTHEAETLLDIMRKQNRKQSEDLLSVIYSTFDFLRDLLQRVNSYFTDVSAEPEAEDMILILKDAIERVKNPLPDEDEFADSEPTPVSISEDEFFNFDNVEQTAQTSTPVVEEFSAPIPEILNAKPSVAEPSENLESFVNNDMMDQYITSATELIDLSENNLLILEKEPENYALVAETFGAIHSLKGNSGFMGLSEIEEISIEMETILDSVRNKELQIDQTVVTILLSNIETIRDRIGKMSHKVAITDVQHDHKAEPLVANVVTQVATQKVEEIETIQNIHDEYDEEEEEQSPQLIPPQDTKPKSAAVAPQAVPQAAAPKAPPKQPQMTQMQKKDIRVETVKIDKLFDLVGELITIETMVTNSPDLSGLTLPNFTKSASMLNKITRELQEITMSVRMMPLEGLFNKMKRLVRDVSLKMDKKVNFEVSGQETEMDKNVIDEIADPLVHILRNAIDHGIESPSVRKQKGKHEIGNISLKARYEGNEILIIVKDDGAGINREKVLKKAIEKGIVTTAPEKMSDKDVYMLVFEPGFSTADKVTDISGRGVGMDVVKKNLEKLHGSVDVTSTLERGSTFTLRIPLTLAIMEAMVIRVGNARYALPLLAVTESFRTNLKNITKTMDGLEVVKIREEVLPVIRLHELFKKQPDSKDLDKGILIIIESREKQVALFADEIVGQQQAVIKGLSDYIGKVPGITGCMILGDGGIGLILDIESLIEMSETNLAEAFI